METNCKKRRYSMPQIKVVPILTESLLTTLSTISGGHKKPIVEPPIDAAKKNAFIGFDEDEFNDNEDEYENKD